MVVGIIVLGFRIAVQVPSPNLHKPSTPALYTSCIITLEKFKKNHEEVFK